MRGVWNRFCVVFIYISFNQSQYIHNSICELDNMHDLLMCAPFKVLVITVFFSLNKLPAMSVCILKRKKKRKKNERFNERGV